MGQHKYNPTAIAAKNGEIPEKPKRPSKRERELAEYMAFQEAMHRKGLLTPFDINALLGNDIFYKY
ncbi:MAG: hypothetical protein IJ899_03055 [Blautia sp.]|nr:hypothetical protein [Blautia sp.]